MSEQNEYKIYTPDGYEVVFISEYFFNLLEKELNKIARIPGSPSNLPKMIVLRDEPASVEFRKFEDKELYKNI